MGEYINIEDMGTGMIPHTVRGFGNEVGAQRHSYPFKEGLPRGPIGNSKVVGVESVSRIEDDLNSEAEMMSMQSMTMVSVMVVVVGVVHVLHLRGRVVTM